MSEMKAFILPCPFQCVTLKAVSVETENGKEYYVECDCGARGPIAYSSDDAVDMWNAAANALAKKNAEIEKLKQWLKNCIDEEKKRADDATEIQHKLNAEIARLTAALADTEEQRHEAVSKLSLALIREVESNKRQDELEAEIEQLRKERHTMCIDYERVEQERDEARKVARHWYKAAHAWMKTWSELIDALPARNEPQSIRVTETTDSDGN